MKIHTPEISWHNREPIFGVDIQKHIEYDNEGNKHYRIATCGSDNFVAIWRAYLNKQQSNSKSTNFLNQQQQPTISSSSSSIKNDQIEQDVNDVMNDLLDQSASAFDNILEFQQPTKSSTTTIDNNNIDEQSKIKTAKDKKLIDLDCVCTLNLHIKAVNVAKFAPISNLLASGSDDQFVYIYEYRGENNQNDKDRCNPFNDFDDSIISKEHWKRIQTLRRHINDVVDLAWSPDERFLITGSVDNISYVWDVKKGEALFELPKHVGYVQGVAWDPLSNFIVTLCTDRNLRIFNAPTTERMKKSTLIHKINKFKFNSQSTGDSKDEKSKTSSLFYDDTLATISRRMSFSANGELLACPSGIIDLDDNDDDDEDGTNKSSFINCLHMFYRGDNFKKLHCYFPTGVYTNSIQFCDQLFKLNPDLPNPYPFPYRLVFAIAAKDRILIYDTQQEYPIAKISDIHYTRLSDISWTSDGQLLLVSSTDGFCTFVYFNENELGERYEGEPYKFETVEAKKKTASVSNTTAQNKKNHKDKLTVDESNVPNENLSAEKTPQPNILNFFKKTKPNPSPLLPTKLANSFQKVADKSPNVINLVDDDSEDCKVIKNVSMNVNANENQPTKNEKKNLDLKSPIIPLKRIPTIDTFLGKSSSVQNTTTTTTTAAAPTTTNQVNSIQHLIKRKNQETQNHHHHNNIRLDNNRNENENSDNIKSQNNNNDLSSTQLPPLKRASSEQNSTEPDQKKKRRINLITLSN